MKKIKLGVNIDHVATVRNARGENYPDPLQAALLAQKYGADSITVHLREDRRHINEYDLKKIIVEKNKIRISLKILRLNLMLNKLNKLKKHVVFLNPAQLQRYFVHLLLILN